MDIRGLVVSGYKFEAPKKGLVEKMQIIDDYISKALSVIDVTKIRPFKVVANTNFGTTGPLLEKFTASLPLTLKVINGEPNGEFPKERPDPLIPENLNQTIHLVRNDVAAFRPFW